MTRISPLAVALGLFVSALELGAPSSADAAGNFQQPTPGDPGDQGIPGFFIVMFVVVLLVGIGVTIWKLSTARKLAKQSGMDPGLATQMTLLSDDGLEATYLAANLRRRPTDTTSAPEAAPTEAPVSAEDRLTKLRSLLDRGVITQAEYDERRKAIIDSL